jgi:hypothetical protein
MSRHLRHLRHLALVTSKREATFKPRAEQRIFFGKGAHEMIHAEYDKRLAEWDKFKDLSEEAHGELPVT